MVVKTTAVYIPLRTVLEKQYFVIRVEETKSRRVEELWRWQLVVVIVIVNVIANTPPQ